LLKTLALLGVLCLGSVVAAGQSADRSVAERVLGPRWKQMARGAGMVFSGTVLAVISSPAQDSAVSTVELKFKVDRAIAGVRAGQVLTVREWAGAWSMHRPMRVGDRVLLLLYPPSKLGLTSPVNGPFGQVALDRAGKSPLSQAATVLQLERAIRSAREE
jgi:hypothetical protein